MIRIFCLNDYVFFCSKRGKQKAGLLSIFYRWINCCFDDETCKLAKEPRHLEPGEKAVESDTKSEKDPDRDSPMSNANFISCPENCRGLDGREDGDDQNENRVRDRHQA